MSRKRQHSKKNTNIYAKFVRRFLATTKKQLIWLLRTVFRTQKQQPGANAGFVLPTVVMVSIVVVLLTTAIMFRSFDRAQTASNVRVNQIAMNSAAPAIDRARAKLKKLFNDNRLSLATPTESGLDGVLVTYKDEYTFGDEINLRINCIDPNISSGLNSGVCLDADDNAPDPLRTAWRFPVDTDNNGKFDSYTLYGIYYKNPELKSDNTQYKVKRNPIQARTTPMTFTSIGGSCGTSKVTSASLVGVNGWFKGNKSLRLVKGFFVYTVTVPITSTTTIPTGTISSKYEINTGNKSFSALEYEQDKVQQSLINNAVVYQDDLAITAGTTFRLNGRIFTNANLLTFAKGGTTQSIRIYQVSSKSSCFYEAENGKITVGGNIVSQGLGTSFNTSTANGNTPSDYTTFDLFPGKAAVPGPADIVNGTPKTEKISLDGNQSVSNATTAVSYNNLAYTQRLNRLVAAQKIAYPDSTAGTGAIQTNDPPEVQEGIKQQKDEIGLSSYTDAQVAQYRSEQLQLYFQKRTRRVPFNEVAFDGDALDPYTTTTPLQGSGDELRPKDTWSFPTNPTNGKTGTGYTGLTLNISGTNLAPDATEPTLLLKNAKEEFLGDRIQVGNNLPQLWWKTSESKFVGPDPSDTQSISGINWNKPASPAENRYRLSQIQTLADVGSTDRDRDWELAAAKIPENPQDPVGGLRVITGAGIYLRSADDATTTSFTGASTTVWSDMNPMPNSVINAKTTQRPYSMYDNGLAFTIPTPSASTPYLKMRATAVYHYKQTGYSQTAPTPIACVSSFYDPTNSTTAKNLTALITSNPTAEWTPPTGFGGGSTGGLSNNGIVYGPPTRGVTDYESLLNYQSTLIYANGRSIDDGLLARALAKTAANRTLSEVSTIDAAICALQILDGSVTASSTVIPHGAIFEAAFLDGRQVKAIHKDNTSTGTVDERFINISPTINYVDSGARPSTDYDLPIRDRQPVEIRATVLDLSKLRTQTIGDATPSQEYLIPNSGIIYATRDDALVDRTSSNADKTANKLESSVDYKLDPTRRPNSIVLVNGSNISRESNYRDAEKGLIVATDLPAYIKGNFNLHSSGEEFKGLLDVDKLSSDWSNFYTRSSLNQNFACRPNDPRLSVSGVDQCSTGDSWRSAAVISDAMTLLSDSYILGFRNQGDYDWNNNSSDPNSITSRSFATGVGTNTKFQMNTYAPRTTYSGTLTQGFERGIETAVGYAGNTYYGFRGGTHSSYLSNFVTPVVRQIRYNSARDYVYEVCDTTRYADCNSLTSDPKSWVITTQDYSASGVINWRNGGTINTLAATSLKTGTFSTPAVSTVPPAVAGWGNFPRRVAFKRDFTTGIPVSPPTVYGVDGSGNVGEFLVSSIGDIRTVAAANNDSTKNRIDLIPALELNSSDGEWQPILWNARVNPSPTSNYNYWSQQPSADATYNVIIAAGDTPARTDEDNGGLENYVRFAENWVIDSSTTRKAIISGSFMQLRKSSYATAPFITSLGDTTALKYAVSNGQNKLPYYDTPIRSWGYDVGILSQSPDLFSQKLVIPVGDLPNEYFREVGRDDPWVQNLLCAKNNGNTAYVIDQNQRPSICQS